MASGLCKYPEFESEEIIELDVDLEMGTIPVGLFTIDLTPTPSTTMRDIRIELAGALETDPDNVTITYNKQRIQDSFVIKQYLEELKAMEIRHFLSLEINANAEKAVAKRLQQKIIELQEKQATKNVVLCNLVPHRDTELIVYKTCFDSYMRKHVT